jgi:hypothetical protein
VADKPDPGYEDTFKFLEILRKLRVVCRTLGAEAVFREGEGRSNTGSIAPQTGNSLDLQLATVDIVVMARDPLSAIGHEEGDHLGDFRRLTRTT